MTTTKYFAAFFAIILLLLFVAIALYTSYKLVIALYYYLTYPFFHHHRDQSRYLRDTIQSISNDREDLDDIITLPTQRARARLTAVGMCACALGVRCNVHDLDGKEDLPSLSQMSNFLNEHYDLYNSRAKRLMRLRFTNSIVISIKAKYGPLKLTEANRLMVRRYALQLCEDRGMRPSHIHDIIDLATTLSFLRSRSEIMSKELLSSSYMIQQEKIYNSVGVSWWQRLCGVQALRFEGQDT